MDQHKIYYTISNIIQKLHKRKRKNSTVPLRPRSSAHALGSSQPGSALPRGPRATPSSHADTDGRVPPVSFAFHLAPLLRRSPSRRCGFPGANQPLHEVRLDPLSSLACSTWSQRAPMLLGHGSGGRNRLGAQLLAPGAMRKQGKGRGSIRSSP